jgi:hypothetical protein
VVEEEPEDGLGQMIFPFVEDSLDKLTTAMDKNAAVLDRYYAAYHFLMLLKKSRRVILQDVAAMMECHERTDHDPLFIPSF